MYKFYVTILSSVVEVHPLNFNQTTINYQKEDGQIFYRNKFNGTLRFYGDDFELFNLVEIVDNCQQLMFEIKRRISGTDTYETYWLGYFSTTEGSFDLDNCTFDVTPLTYDNYMVFDEHGDDEYNILDIPTSVTTHVNYNTSYTYTRNRWLMDVIEFLADKIVPGINVSSIILDSTYNYLTGGDNVYNLLTIAQKSDIKRPTSSNPATIAMLSYNELMDILKMMNLYWKYDGATLTIEHISWFDNAAGMDIRTQKIAQKSNKYSYSKDKMPKYEKFSHMEAGNINFLPGTIYYDSMCVNQDSKSNISEYSNRVTTDVEYIIECMLSDDTTSNISDEGFVILANHAAGGGSYDVYVGTAFENNDVKFNNYLSWSYLFRMFFMHDRVLMDGYMNTELMDFISVRKTKKQKVNAIVCRDNAFDPEEYFTTELGETYFGGQKGFVENCSLKPSGEAELSLEYGEDENTLITVPAPIKVIHVVTSDGLTVKVYLSEKNPYTTIFWLWLDGGTCQEISISAGVTYHTEALDITPPATTEFILDDPSTTGWTFYWNDNEPIVEPHVHMGCGPGVPPAIPAAPVLSTVNQSGPCQPIRATWAASAGATSYQVYRKPDAYMVDAYGIVATAYGVFWDDVQAGLEDATTFYYKVKACNISGCSADSNELNKTSTC